MSGIWESLTWLWWLDFRLKTIFATVVAASKMTLSSKVVISDSKISLNQWQHAEIGYETKFQTVQFPFDIKFIYYNTKKQNISAIELGDCNFVECFKKKGLS